MTAQADGRLSTTCAPLAGKTIALVLPLAFASPAPSVLATFGALSTYCPRKITKLRRPSRPLIARMRATGSANSSMALSRATH